ncbi:hypothetical protein SLEP1_g21404 [Rubroshorea leprosula]|uniref:Uncharacterized protein n=1 Tax=Rubroshorea leprosula TaxID=152421 RepID=A0AAV5JBX7_9ROSI|nr:hypothetical protein SLEP1_g21404 [Rubroshorea leprosula]
MHRRNQNPTIGLHVSTDRYYRKIDGCDLVARGDLATNPLQRPLTRDDSYLTRQVHVETGDWWWLVKKTCKVRDVGPISLSEEAAKFLLESVHPLLAGPPKGNHHLPLR